MTNNKELRLLVRAASSLQTADYADNVAYHADNIACIADMEFKKAAADLNTFYNLRDWIRGEL